MYFVSINGQLKKLFFSVFFFLVSLFLIVCLEHKKSATRACAVFKMAPMIHAILPRDYSK